jgi:hypothetical protein
MSFSSVKNTCYIAKKMLLGIQYSFDLFQTLSNVSIMYKKTFLYTFTKHFSYSLDLELFKM